MSNNNIAMPIITAEMFKLHSPVTQNTEITDFIPYISIAQELYVLPILGEPLMAELKVQITNNSLSEANSNLLVKVAPVLAYYTVYQGLPFHWAAIVNKGVTTRESENSKSVTINDINQLRTWIKDDAERLSKILIQYLCKCQSNYPSWRPQNNCCESIIREGSTDHKFETGFYFGKKNKGCGCN